MAHSSVSVPQYEDLTKQIDKYLSSKGISEFNGYHLNSDWSKFDRWEYNVPEFKINEFKINENKINAPSHKNKKMKTPINCSSHENKTMKTPINAPINAPIKKMQTINNLAGL